MAHQLTNRLYREAKYSASTRVKRNKNYFCKALTVERNAKVKLPKHSSRAKRRKSAAECRRTHATLPLSEVQQQPPNSCTQLMSLPNQYDKPNGHSALPALNALAAAAGTTRLPKLNWNYLHIFLSTLLLFTSLFGTLKLVNCLRQIHCGLPLAKHWLIVGLLIAVLLNVALVYRIMFILSSFWERLSFHNQAHKAPVASPTAKPNNGSHPSAEIHITMANIALVSQYVQVERPQLENNNIPSINLQLLDEETVIGKSIQNYRNTKVKKLSISSIEMGSEFLRKYGATDDWLGRLNDDAHLKTAISSDSVATESSDYYLELPGENRRRCGTPTPPGSPALRTTFDDNRDIAVH